MATVRVPTRGKFRHIVKLENPAKPPDGAGGRTEDFEAFVTTRGVFRKRSGFRNFEQGYDQLVSEHECFLTWRSEFDSHITKDTRLVYDNRVFKIVSKEYVNQQRSIMYFILIEAE